MFATTKIKSLASFLTLLTSLWAPPRPPAEPPTITVLCYHTFDSAKKTPYTVSGPRFAEEMRYLSVQKIPVIPLSALTGFLYNKETLPERAVVITIDDGYKTAKDVAWPILKRYGYPFTLFVYPHAINRFRSALTWQELHEMAEAGVDIESHSMTHPLLTHPAKAMNKKEYQAWLGQELADSKRWLEQELKHPVSSIAYPYGGYDEFVLERTRAAGYKTAFTCDDGDVSSFTDPFLLNRRLVFRQTSLKAFTGYFQSCPIQLADLSPKDGERVKDIPKEIEARVVNLQTILPGSAQILVDKLGKEWHPIQIDPKSGVFRFPLPSTASGRNYYFVSITAKDRADPAIRREASWLFIVRRIASIK